jgi:hypothetical protein
MLGQKNKGHIYCAGTNRQRYSQILGPTVFHIGLSQKALHTKVKHLGEMQYHMLHLLTDEMQLVFSANPIELTQIKYHILFQFIQKHFQNM